MDINERVKGTIQAVMAENRREGMPLYAFRPIPCEIDKIATAFVRMFMEATPTERQLISAAVPPREGAFLYSFAGRMATLAVRQSSRERVLEGLIALIIEGYKEDFRDNMIRLGPLYDAALKIGAEPQELFDEAASYLPNETARDIIAFPQRPSEERTLKAMGYRESSDSDGFKYERDY